IAHARDHVVADAASRFGLEGTLARETGDLARPRQEFGDLGSIGAQRSEACQFRLLPTSARSLIHGIMARSLAPTSSIGCWASLARVALNEVWLTLFSSIQSLTKRPDWMSARMRFISALVSAFTTRGPETYSPYSAVFDTE